MNLLLHPDPAVCERFLSLLGVAASIATVDEDGGFRLFASNELTRDFYQMERFEDPVRVSAEDLTSLLRGEWDPAPVQAYVDRMLMNYRTCVEQRKTLNTETELQLPDGVEVWSRNTLTPIFDGDRVARILVTFVEVTEMRRAREKLEQSLASLIASMISVCDGCGKVADGDEWITMAEYMQRHSDRSFTHGICTRCAETYFGREA
ncbi:MAG: hypothetical protein U5O39_11280 [Gammaproteobacteria bacterium]|nr:hypothetical protein [Gammaproteobacteria bacterium]